MTEAFNCLPYIGISYVPVSSEGPSPCEEENTYSSTVVMLIEKTVHLICPVLYKENILLITPEVWYS